MVRVMHSSVEPAEGAPPLHELVRWHAERGLRTCGVWWRRRASSIEHMSCKVEISLQLFMMARYA